MKSSGFTLAVKSPVIDAIQNVNRQARGAAASGDGRAAALHAMAAAGGVADLAGAAGAMGGPLNGNGKPEAKIELSFGASRSKTTFTEDSTRQSGSTVRAGGRAAFIATGEKAAGQGNVTIEGSAVTAGDVLLQATDRVNLLSSTDTDKTRSTNESTSASAGVSFGSSGWGVSAAMSRAKGDANSDAVTHNNTHVQAGNTVTIKSGGDTNIVGANVSAKRVMGDIGGDLNIASEQDTVRSASRQSSVGGGFSVSQGGGSASFSARSGRASGNYAGVGEQSGIAVGDGGFDITVKGNTDLKGTYIASTADPDKNRLRTGTLSFSDVQNSSSYSARSVGISAGGGFGDGGSNYATHGPSSGKNSGGALPLAVSERGSSEALTRSAISAGGITITDEANQKQDIAMLNRDATNLNGIIDQLPDLQATLSNQADLIDAAQAAAEAVAKQVGKYAEKKRDEALTAAKAETDPKLKVQYEQAAQDWAEGGKNRVGLHIAGGALTGGLTGGGVGAVGGAAGAALSAKLAPKFDELARSIKEAGPTGNANVDQLIGNVTANVLAGGAGALVGGSTGALTSAAADRFNRQLRQSEYDDAKRHAKAVAKELGLSEQEAEGRIVAEILRNSDKQTAEASGGKRDYEVRSIVGCQNLNCDGYKNDPQYANHDYNAQYIEPNRVSYNRGQGELDSGLTDAELRQENLPYERTGKLALTGAACVLSGGVACKAAATGLGTSALFNFATDKPLSFAEAIGGLYGGAIGGIYGANLRLWVGEANAWFEKAVLGGTKLAPAFVGKQVGVPLANSTGLGRSVDPLFDPASNPWWGYENLINQFKRGDQ